MTRSDLDAWLITYGAAAVPCCYLCCQKLLPGGTHSRLGFLILLIVLATVAIYSRSDPAIDSKSVAATVAPLVAFWIYGAMRQFFVRRMGRPPVNVAFNWNSGLFYDRVFAFIVFLGLVYGTIGCFVLFEILVPGDGLD